MKINEFDELCKNFRTMFFNFAILIDRSQNAFYIIGKRHSKQATRNVNGYHGQQSGKSINNYYALQWDSKRITDWIFQIEW